MSLYAIVRELLAHSTLGGYDKARLLFHLDTADPQVESPPPAAEPVTPETPDQELARLRAMVAAATAIVSEPAE